MRKENNGIEGDESALFERARNGDEEAIRILAERNIELVKKIIFSKKHKFFSFISSHYQCEIEDIIQDGYLGLLDALQKCDLYKHRVKFQTYASYRIIGAILDARRTSSFLPRSVMENLKKIFQAEKELETQNAQITTENIARHLNWSVARVEKVLIYGNYRFSLSLDQSIEEDDGSTIPLSFLSISISPLEEFEEKELKTILSTIIAGLPEKERICINLYFGFNDEPKTLKEIGIGLNLSEARISQIKSDVLTKLRKNRDIRILRK